jgi:hypothetical protein
MPAVTCRGTSHPPKLIKVRKVRSNHPEHTIERHLVTNSPIQPLPAYNEAAIHFLPKSGHPDTDKLLPLSVFGRFIRGEFQP